MASDDIKLTEDIVIVTNKLLKRIEQEDITSFYDLDKSFLIKFSEQTFSDEKEFMIFSKLKKLELELKSCKIDIEKFYINGNETNNESNYISQAFSQIMNIADPFKSIKYHISHNLHGQLVTSTWLKYWEILSKFKLIPNNKKEESFILFENSDDFSSISALNHYIKTKTFIKSSVWYVRNRKNEKNNNKKNTNKESIYNYYENRCLDIENHEVMNNIQGTVNLFTSNMGLPVEEYIDQELHFKKEQQRQIELGIKLLIKGGNMIVRQYTFFDIDTIKLIYSCYLMFDNVYISKPKSSKVTNSESFIVCQGFKGYIKHEENNDIPIWFYQRILDIAIEIYSKQINILKLILKLINDVLNSVNNINDTNDKLNSYNYKQRLILSIAKELKNNYKQQHKKITSLWLNDFSINSLKQKDKLRI